jgi:hypothetical protein
MHQSTTPSDWILKKTKQAATFLRIAEMLIWYSKYFKWEVEKYNLQHINMDDNFLEKIEEYIQGELK